MKPRLAILLILLPALAINGGPAGTSSSDKFVSGLELFNAGDFMQAATRLAAAVTAIPTDFAARLTAGVALANVKRYPEAVDQFKAAGRIAPAAALPQFLLDGTYAELGKQPLARQARTQGQRLLTVGTRVAGRDPSDRLLTASLSRYPQNAIAHCLLGDVYQLEGKAPAARQQYDKSSKLAPKWAKPVFNLGIAELDADPKSAEKRFDQVIKMDPSNSRAYLWKGDALAKQGRYEDAVGTYKRAADDKSLAAEAATRVGNAFMLAGDYAAAGYNFDIAAQQAPQDPRPIAGKAQVLQKSGKLEEAEQTYEQAADVMYQNQAPAPSQAAVQRQIGTVRVQMGEVKGAASNYAAGLELHPTLENAEALARAHQDLNQLDAQIASREAALQKDPNDMSALLYLLAAHGIKGNQLARVNVAGRLASLDKANAPTYYAEIGAARMRLGDSVNAVEAYSRSLEVGNRVTWADTAVSAKDSGALGLLRADRQNVFDAFSSVQNGTILYELQRAAGDVPGMLDTTMVLVKANPNDPALWLQLGETYECAGNPAMAEMAYSKAAAGPDPAVAATARARLEGMRKPAGK